MSCCGKRKCLSFFTACFVVISTLAGTSGVAASGQKLRDQYEIPSFNGVEYNADSTWYMDYIKRYEQSERVTEPIPIDLSGNSLYKAAEGGEQALVWDEATKKLDFTFEVSQEGLYNLALDYCAYSETVTAPRRNVYIDGEQPYRELNNIEFLRVWKDNGKPFKNPIGDDVRPSVSQVKAWQNYRITDIDGLYSSPLEMYLTKGPHTLTLEFVYEPLWIRSISFVPPEIIQPYAEVLEGYERQGYRPASKELILDAEFPAAKSDSSIRMGYSGDPLADPPSDGNQIINVIGGGSWNKGNQSLSYEFEVEEAGLYQINLRHYQKYANGMPVYRQIAIDGKVPFKEFLSYGIDHSGWTYKELGSSDREAYLLYLEPGKTHTLTLTSKLTGYAEVLKNLHSILNDLSYMIRKITMVTSVSPDLSLDYKLDEKIPDLMEVFARIKDRASSQITYLKSMSTTKSAGAASSLEKLRLDMTKLIDKPIKIAANLSSLSDTQISLSSWLTSFSNCDLQLDYIALSPGGTTPKDYRSNIFQIMYQSFRTFILSFTKDYNSVLGLRSTETGEINENISVWISRGKDWGDVLKQMVDEDFTASKGIGVNLNVLPAGQLGASGIVLMAVASGNQPDIILGADAGLATEYGMRESVEDLSKYEGFDDVSKRFLPGLLRAYQYRDGVYGIPETMDFPVLYYRSDILQELSLKIPETWQDVYNYVLPTLKKNGMDFWYEGGLNTFLYQNNGGYYREGDTKSALDLPQATEAFRQWTDLYRVYDLPVTTDFYSRFRTGQIPIGISSFTTYIKLTSAAPEIQNKWGVAQLPGTLSADGKINRAADGASSSCVIFSDSKAKNAAWEFIKWYTDSPAQERYTRDIASFIGSEARWFSANLNAFDSLSWEYNLKDVVVEQRNWFNSQYNVVGGYITARHVENARVRTVVEKMNYRESLEIAVKEINRELAMKNEEFEMRQKHANK